MEKYAYNSYPDSAGSSPRSREIDFENPSPWEDQQQQPQTYKVKFMCSYGGKIQPRPHDNQLSYVGGETKILSVDRGIKFASMLSKLAVICDGEVSFKYQLPGEDLDSLISVTNDDDLEHMMHEYDRLLRSSPKPARMRLFLFSVAPSSSRFGSEESSKSDRDRFVEALNSGPARSEIEKPVTAPPTNADFLFGSDKGGAVPPAVKVNDSLPVPMAPGVPVVGDQQMISPDHGLNPAEVQRQLQELQRLQIRDQEQQQQQQQEALYRRKSEDNIMETGGYYPQTFVQNPQPTNVQQTAAPAPAGFWQGKHNPGGVFSATSAGIPEQQVYMIPAQSPGTVYHAPPPAMMRQVSGQAAQGYYPNLQRMAPDAYREHPAYNLVQPPPAHPQAGTQAPPQFSAPLQQFSTAPQYSAPQARPVSSGGAIGLTDTGYGQVYYTAPGGGIVVSQPQYQGGGMTVSGGSELRAGQDGKVVSKISPGSI